MQRYGTLQQRNSTLRLGPVKIALGAGVGCLGMLAIGLAIYAVSALFWGWVFMLIHGAVIGNGSNFTPGYWTKPWGFWDAVVPWGLVAPFVLG